MPLAACPNQATWFSYYAENMRDLSIFGDPDDTLYGNFKTVAENIAYLMGINHELGGRYTLGTLITRGSNLARLGVTVGGSMAGYLGAMVGSAAVATGRYAACGSYMIDILAFTRMHGWDRPDITQHLLRHPEIYTPGHPARRMYARLVAKEGLA